MQYHLERKVMRYCIGLFVAVLTALSCFGQGVYLKIEEIPGEVMKRGLEGMIELQAFSHEVISPRDPASGLPTGRRQHKPFRCVIVQEKSLPLLMKALTDNQVIPKAEIWCFRVSVKGTEELYFRYELEDVSVASVRPWMPNVKDESAAEFGTQVEVSFVYRTITWTAPIDNITHEDSWSIQE